LHGSLGLAPSRVVTRLADCVDDFDATVRPPAAGQFDVGGDALGQPLFADGFESGDTSALSVVLP
jgi:hypothetical protein